MSGPRSFAELNALIVAECQRADRHWAAKVAHADAHGYCGGPGRCSCDLAAKCACATSGPVMGLTGLVRP